MENFRIKLELKSKFFKDELLKSIQENDITILHKKVVPHFKTSFIIELIIGLSESRKLKNIIKEIEEIERENERLFLELKRKEYGL